MARGINRLTGADLRRTKSGLFCDGEGLWLQVSVAANGARRNRSWVFRYTRAGRTREMGLGSLNTLQLAEARERARKCRQLLLDGIDPLEARNSERAAKAAESMKQITFEAAANAFISAHRHEWRSQVHAAQWPSSLRKHIYPTLGKMPVAQIDTPLVLKALQPIWAAVPETASRLRGRIESILDWATVSGYRAGDNPARWGGHLEHLLAAPSKRQVEHLAAMPWREMPAFMAKLRAIDTIPARAFEFVILCGSRRDEVRKATWNEIDFTTATWTIPAARMKGGEPHRVPLSPRCVAILRDMQAARKNDFIFLGQDGHLGKGAFGQIIRRLSYDGQVTLHGFRATLRTWSSEATGFAHEVCERALAHAVGSKTQRSYERGDQFGKRRRLMEAWALYLAKPAPVGATVTELMRPSA